ncbi:MAG TPA: amidohydrolase [Anaerolineales bacterium]|jgi:5-methylthioadenosine/S-adenosylhomocysteine deaminase|nr:amidohydrolase [Anaerolineales bacterium]
MTIDLLIKNGAVITMDAQRRVIENGDVAVNDGEIIAIGVGLEHAADKTISARGCVVAPGFINAHSHVYQSLIEGIGYDMHFDPWNWRFLFPVVSKIKPEHARASAALAALEMIRNGVTTISDHWYLHTDMENIYQVTETFDKAGLRAQMVFGLLDQTFAGERIDSEYMTMIQREDILVDEARRYYDTWHKTRRTTIALGPGSTEDISESLMSKTVELARELDVNVSTHVAGWIEINSYTIRQFGERDLEHFHSLGLTGPRGVMFHAVWLSDREIELIAKTGTKVVHCPVANAYLGYGIAPISHMLSRGIPIGLGTDGAASYTYDMLEVGRTAAMLQKATKLDAEAVTAEQILEMLTINGARVLGIEDQVGSLETGKRADILVIDFNQPHLLPGGRWVPKLIYSARGSDVTHTIVDGQLIMEDHRVLSMDESQVLEKAIEARENLVALAGQETRDLLAAPWPQNGPAWRGIVKK